jgi:endoglucanase
VSGAITNAKIRLFGSNSSSGSVTINAFSVSDTLWSEATITWNNKPTSGATALAGRTVSGTTQAWYEWDATSYVQSERAAGRNVISIAFKASATTSFAFNANSSEATSNQAQMVVTQ